MHKLTPRLRKIASLVPMGSRVADIGTDHAYIPAYLAAEKIAVHAIASDINIGPIESAKKTIEKYGVGDIVETRLGSGLEPILPGDADVIIIAGMGGELISAILNKSQEVAKSAKLLILQPMTAVFELREHLSNGKFDFKGEYLVREGEKIYNIIAVRPGSECRYSLKELYLGKKLEETAADLYSAYYKRTVEKLEKAARGLKKSSDEKNIQKYNEIKNIIEELGSDSNELL